MERVAQPTDTSCWDTCVSMLTGIDVDLFPLDYKITPHFIGPKKFKWFGPRVWKLAKDSMWRAWVDFMDDNGFVLESHESPPEGPYMLALVLYLPPGADGRVRLDGHAIVVEDGIILDPSPTGLTGEPVGVLDSFCNLITPKGGYLTIRPKEE